MKLGVDGAIPIPPDDAGKNEVIAALVANVQAMIKADRKITALKQLQVSRSFKKNKKKEREEEEENCECTCVYTICMYVHSS